MKLYLDEELVDEWDMRFSRDSTRHGALTDWTLSVGRWRSKHGPGSMVDVELHIGDVVLHGKAREVQVHWGEGIGATSDLEGSSDLTPSS